MPKVISKRICFCSARPEAIWIDADEELRESLKGRLERYVIADDVVVEEVSDEFVLFHVVAEKAPQISGVKFSVSSRRLAQDGWDVWGERSEREGIEPGACDSK